MSGTACDGVAPARISASLQRVSRTDALNDDSARPSVSELGRAAAAVAAGAGSSGASASLLRCASQDGQEIDSEDGLCMRLALHPLFRRLAAQCVPNLISTGAFSAVASGGTCTTTVSQVLAIGAGSRLFVLSPPDARLSANVPPMIYCLDLKALKLKPADLRHQPVDRNDVKDLKDLKVKPADIRHPPVDRTSDVQLSPDPSLPRDATGLVVNSGATLACVCSRTKCLVMQIPRQHANNALAANSCPVSCKYVPIITLPLTHLVSPLRPFARARMTFCFRLVFILICCA